MEFGGDKLQDINGCARRDGAILSEHMPRLARHWLGTIPLAYWWLATTNGLAYAKACLYKRATVWGLTVYFLKNTLFWANHGGVSVPLPISPWPSSSHGPKVAYEGPSVAHRLLPVADPFGGGFAFVPGPL